MIIAKDICSRPGNSQVSPGSRLRELLDQCLFICYCVFLLDAGSFILFVISIRRLVFDQTNGCQSERCNCDIDEGVAMGNDESMADSVVSVVGSFISPASSSVLIRNKQWRRP